VKIVQTFWSGNKTNVLNDSFGWVHAKYHLQSWALSCQLLRKLYDDVELYTDQVGYDLFIKKLKLPYSKVHVVLDELNHYPSDVWALSKIHTYSLQQTPFIHIDGDVFLWNHFSDELLTSEFVVQNREIGNTYFDTSWNTLEEKLLYIPKEILHHRQKDEAVNVYNFGIFGGNNIDFIQKYCQKAFAFVEQNTEVLNQLKHLNFNIFFEQYLFYCMIQGQHVSAYFSQDIVADQYTGLANFHEVPAFRSYLHLLGDFKKKPEVCENISRQLAVEFPEQYLRCLEVLESNDKSLFNLQYYGASTDTSAFKNTSFAQFYSSTSDQQKFGRTKNILQNMLANSKETHSDSFASKSELHNFVNREHHELGKKVFDYELKIDSYLKSLTNLDFADYAESEYRQMRLYPQFLEHHEAFPFQSPTVSTMIRVPFLPGEPPLAADEDPLEDRSRLILPIPRQPFYKEIILDVLEEAILEESKDAITITQLVQVMKQYFDETDIQKNYTNYEKLIRKSARRLLFQGALNFTVSDNKILSRRIDTNLECL